MTARECVERLELPERLGAILDEIDVLDGDTDVVRTLALRLLEDVDRIVHDDDRPSDRRRS
jgi:hypothetical protein